MCDVESSVGGGGGGGGGHKQPSVSGATNSQSLSHPNSHNPYMVDTKLQEIMLKNIWEIENNPVFNSLSSGGSSDHNHQP